MASASKSESSSILTRSPTLVDFVTLFVLMLGVNWLLLETSQKSRTESTLHLISELGSKQEFVAKSLRSEIELAVRSESKNVMRQIQESRAAAEKTAQLAVLRAIETSVLTAVSSAQVAVEVVMNDFGRRVILADGKAHIWTYRTNQSGSNLTNLMSVALPPNSPGRNALLEFRHRFTRARDLARTAISSVDVARTRVELFSELSPSARRAFENLLKVQGQAAVKLRDSCSERLIEIKAFIR